MQTNHAICAAQPALFDPHALGRFGGVPSATSVVRCPPRQLFATESEFEMQLMHDPDGLAVLARMLGCTTATLRNQVETHEQLRTRADIVVIGKQGDAPVGVIEIQLDPLNHDHCYRGLSYALALGARHLVFVAPGLTDRAAVEIEQFRVLLRSARNAIQVHVLELRTYLSRSRSRGSYELVVQSRAHAPAPITLRVLQAIGAFAVEAGDTSLVGLNPDRDRRYEVYRGLRYGVSVRVAANRDSVTLSIHRVDRAIRRRLLRRHLAERLAQEFGGRYLRYWNSGGPNSSVLVSYTFPAPLDEDQNIDHDVARAIARCFIQLRSELARALGDADSARRSTQRRVRVGYHPSVGAGLGFAREAAPDVPWGLPERS